MFDYEATKSFIKSNLVNIIPNDLKKEFKLDIILNKFGSEELVMYRKNVKKKKYTELVSSVKMTDIFEMCKNLQTEDDYLTTLSSFIEEIINIVETATPSKESALRNASIFIPTDEDILPLNESGAKEFAGFSFRGLECVYNINPILDTNDDRCEQIKLLPTTTLSSLNLSGEELYDASIANFLKDGINIESLHYKLREEVADAFISRDFSKEELEDYYDFIDKVENHNIKYITNGKNNVGTLLLCNNELKRICSRLKCSALYILYLEEDYIIIMPSNDKNDKTIFNEICRELIDLSEGYNESFSSPTFFYNERLDFLFRIDEPAMECI